MYISAKESCADDCRDAGGRATQDAKAERRSVYKIHEDASTLLTKLFRKKTILYTSLLCGLWFVGGSSYIHIKAIVAQLLLETAWSETGPGQKEVKPWPWADTWPVARLSAPRLDISHIVLAGASGSSLAFGPGHLFNSAAPGDKGNVIISGHRDTHFAFLQDLASGDHLLLESPDKSLRQYTVTATRIVNKDETPTIPVDRADRLVLITCYPFVAIRAGGPLRYVVIAEADPVVST